MDHANMTSGHARHINREARDMEFVALYNETLKLMVDRDAPSPRRSAIRFVINNGHPRYYVSYKRAYEVVRQLVRRGKMPIQPSLQAQMWQELANRVTSLCADTGMSVARALEFVLEHCRATRFYITEAYADSIIDRARRQYHKKLCRL